MKFALMVICIILFIVSGLGLIIGVLLHSGKGTGVSEAIMGQIGNTSGLATVEKNLDRITVIFAVIFMVTLLAMMFVYPLGTIG